jgi:hypothetical protein
MALIFASSSVGVVDIQIITGVYEKKKFLVPISQIQPAINFAIFSLNQLSQTFGERIGAREKKQSVLTFMTNAVI